MNITSSLAQRNEAIAVQLSNHKMQVKLSDLFVIIYLLMLSGEVLKADFGTEQLIKGIITVASGICIVIGGWLWKRKTRSSLLTISSYMEQTKTDMRWLELSFALLTVAFLGILLTDKLYSSHEWLAWADESYSILTSFIVSFIFCIVSRKKRKELGQIGEQGKDNTRWLRYFIEANKNTRKSSKRWIYISACLALIPLGFLLWGYYSKYVFGALFGILMGLFASIIGYKKRQRELKLLESS